MKYLPFLLLFISCGRDVPIVQGDYIVHAIRDYKDSPNLCKYICKNPDAGNELASIGLTTWPAIIAPCGLFQINDTVKLCK